MNVIHLKKGEGKTVEAIKIAHDTYSYLVVKDMERATKVYHYAIENGYQIPFPIKFETFLNKKYHGKGIKGFVIDDADLLLSKMVNVPLKAITLTKEE